MTPEETGRWLFAIAKHLKVYAINPQLAYLYATQHSARHGDLLLRLRGHITVGRTKLEAFALDAGIAVQEIKQVVARLEATGLVSVHWSRDQRQIEGVTETIFTEREVFRATARLFETMDPRPCERAMVPILDLTSQLPTTEQEILERLCQQGVSEPDVRRALELQEAFGLLRRQYLPDLGVDLLYNEYLWAHKIGQTSSVLAKLGRRETDGLRALIEEVQEAQGRPLDQLTAAPRHIVALAAKTGILDTTTIITASRDSKTFAFSPHFYGYRAGTQPSLIDDHSDQVKLFVASITYGVNHSADFRLHSPLAFVNRLLCDGEAGRATPILRDYALLERQGIVSVEERIPGRGTFILQKRDVVQQALDVMTSGCLMRDDGRPEDARVLTTQRSFRTPEEDRLVAKFGQQAGDTTAFDRDYLAAIREAVQGGML